MICKAAFVQLAACVLFTVGNALGAPVIVSFSPKAGAPGDQIQLLGSGFSGGGITVRFWNGGSGVPAVGSVLSDTTIAAVVPSGITTGPISVQQFSGPQSFTADDFLVIGAGPYISGFLPTFGEANDTVVINGVHLGNTLAVLFNGTNTSEFSPNSDGTQISTRVPLKATSGPITVSTIFGTSNSPSAFTVLGPGPYISGFLPTSGDSGTQVSITGIHFTTVTNVTFNGQPGLIVSANSDTLIQVLAPANVTTGPIAVQTVLGTVITASNFFARPTIASFTPAAGRVNTNVTVKGTNFLGATTVSFNGVPSANFTVLNNSNLTAAVPAGASTGPIRVITPEGSAFSATNFVIRPAISGFSPGFGPVGASITIKGANLNVGTPVVKFNGVQAAAPTSITFTQLVAKVPTGASTGPITVSTSDGSDTSSTSFFVPASITSFTPTNSAPGSRITIVGQNFIGTTKVGFNGTASPDFTVTNNTTIGAAVPAGFVTGPIYITTPAGIISSAASFYGAPSISGFTPSHGLPGTNVTIKGVNFLGGSAQFNGINAAISFLNNTQMVATVPIGAQTGPITVFGPAGTNSSNVAFVVDSSPMPPILSIGQTGGVINVSWPAALTNYLLQFDDSFSSTPQWLAFTNLPVTSGDVQFITDTNNGSGRFYRLHQQ